MLDGVPMKHLVLGATGQLAHDLLQVFREHYPLDEVIAATHQDIEISSESAVRDLISHIRPETVINTAAYNRVDDCEINPGVAFAVNSAAPIFLARASEGIGATLVQFSSDYVFDGKRHTPYTETDLANPISVYGISRLAGETAALQYCSKALVVRTCGLYGVAGQHSTLGNFVETMLRLARSGKPLSVVNDQVVTPTSTRELAERLVPLIRERACGLFHMTNTSSCTWYEFAKEIFRLSRLQVIVDPITSEQFGARARRPSFSVLDNSALRERGYPDFEPWQQALERFLSQRGDLCPL